MFIQLTKSKKMDIAIERMNLTKCGVLLLLLLFRLDISNAKAVEDTIESKALHRIDRVRYRNKGTTIATNVLPYDDSQWSIKSRGLGVGEATKKVFNKKDSMGKLVSGEEEGDGILQEKTKEKSMQRDKVYKGNGHMNSGKKNKGTS
jgi:hypothetical protein